MRLFAAVSGHAGTVRDDERAERRGRAVRRAAERRARTLDELTELDRRYAVHAAAVAVEAVRRSTRAGRRSA